jgi:HTH-type transcriptional regulator / antitoxin HigA
MTRSGKPDAKSSGTARAAHIGYQPRWTITPGELLKAEIAQRGMSQSDLAARAKLTEKHVSQVMTGTATLTPDVALALERSLGVPARTLLVAEAHHQAERSRHDANAELAKLESWAREFPLRALRSNNILTGAEHGGELVDRLLRFFGVADKAAFEQVSLAGISGFRRAQHLNVDDYATATWLRLGELQTENHKLPPYRAEKLRRCVTEIRLLTRCPDGEAFARAREELGACGVALAFVNGINESRACGATRWVSASRPLVVLSDRYQYRDTLWFSLMHEIGHILRHQKRRTFISLASNGDDQDGLEAEANEFAADMLVPRQYRDRLSTATTPSDFNALADEVGVDVTIIAGQRGHLTSEWRKVQPLRKKLDVAALRHAATDPLPDDASAAR